MQCRAQSGGLVSSWHVKYMRIALNLTLHVDGTAAYPTILKISRGMVLHNRPPFHVAKIAAPGCAYPTTVMRARSFAALSFCRQVFPNKCSASSTTRNRHEPLSAQQIVPSPYTHQIAKYVSAKSRDEKVRSMDGAGVPMGSMFADSLLDGEYNASGGPTRDLGEEVICVAQVHADNGSTVHGNISLPPTCAERHSCSVVPDLPDDSNVLDGGNVVDEEKLVAEMERDLSDRAGCRAAPKVSLRAHDHGNEGHTVNGGEDRPVPWNEKHRRKHGADPVQQYMDTREVGQARIGSPEDYTNIDQSGLVTAAAPPAKERHGRLNI